MIRGSPGGLRACVLTSSASIGPMSPRALLVLMSLAASAECWSSHAGLPRPLRALSQRGSSSIRSGVRNVNGRRITAPVFTDVCEHTGVTLTRYCIEFAKANPDLAELSSILACVQSACKSIAHLVRHAPLTGLSKARSAAFADGSSERHIETMAHDVLRNALRFTGKVAILASTEQNEPEDVAALRRSYDEYHQPAGNGQKQLLVSENNDGFVAVFNAIDAPRDAEQGLPAGTIFGIFDGSSDELCLVPEGDDVDPEQAARECLARTLQPGKSLLCSGFCSYTATTSMVLTLGAGVHAFTLDEASGEFVLSQADISLPDHGSLLCVDTSEAMYWDASLRAHVEAVQKAGGQVRGSGSVVADMHRLLLTGGGLLARPPDREHPDGPLRVVYEGAPLAFLAEQAGGAAVTGLYPLMDVKPLTLEQCAPILLGSSTDVDAVVKAYQAEAALNPSLKARCDHRVSP